MKTHRINRFAVLGGLLASSLLLLGAGPASPQSMDSRWLPWVGCWEPIDSAGTAQEEGPMICFRPVAGQQGVEMLSVQGDHIASHRMIVADGRARQEGQEGCTGTTRAQFSNDGQRVFTVADMTCGGGQERKTTGIMSLDRPTQWLDVKSLDVGGQSTPWVERYTLASPARTRAVGLADIGANRTMSILTARMAAESPLDINDVIEATKVVDPDAVKAWVAERGDRFDLNAAQLVRMKKAGVPSGVIDVMVAVTYPNKFALNGAPAVRAEQAPRRAIPSMGYYPRSRFMACDPFFWDPYCYGYGYGYGYFGYGYNPYFSGFYPGLGFGGYYYGGGYAPVLINPQPTTNPGHGRIVKGRGYVPSGSGTSSGTATRRSGGQAVVVPSGSASSGGGVSTPRPASRGTPTGRTAHRRGGGGR